MLWTLAVCCPAVAQDGFDEEELPPKKPAAAVPAVAESYIVLESDESLRRAGPTISQSLRRGFSSGDAALFDEYCDGYLLPQMTQPENLHELSDLRQKFRNQLLSAKNTATRRHFNNYLLDKLSKMASGNYHPAVRYNCMLLLGELDLAPPARFGEPATPLPEALPILLNALADKNQIDAVRVAALVGIARHSWSLGDEQSRRRVTEAMLTLVKSKHAAKTSAVGYDWMRLMAIDTLGNLKSAGPQNATALALLRVVDDDQQRLSLRCTAARAVGKLDYKDAGGLNPGDMVRQLGRVALDACKTELQQCEQKDRVISPRILKSRLLAVRAGLMGTDEMRSSAPTGGAMQLLKNPEEKKNAAAICRYIDNWASLLDDERLMKQLEPDQQRGRQSTRGMLDLDAGMGAGGFGRRMPEQQDEIKIASDEVIARIKADLKGFAALLH